jgi:DedD protein
MAEPPTLSNDESVKKRAFGRLAIALVLIAAAIGGLMLIERRSAEEPKPAVPMPAPLETPANTADSTPPPTPEVSRVPDSQAVPPAPAASPQVPAGVPEATPPMTATAPAKPAEHIPIPAQPSAPAAAATPPKTSSAILKLEDAPIAPGKGYTVQMGVFNAYANADILLAKLKERGVPAYTETRVVVGPFRTKQEAKKAAVTLKDLGETAIISPPKRSRSK